jgi:hypothetical protein
MHKWSKAGTGALRKRVRGLVDTYFNGSESSAAKAWHVRQSTLNRFLNERTSRPHVEFVSRIAQYHGIPVDWLLNGSGPGPALVPKPLDLFEQWSKLVSSLDLPPITMRAVRLLPNQVGRAFEALVLGRPSPEQFGEQPRILPLPMVRAIWHAVRHELYAWTQLLEGMVAAYGRDAVRDAIQEDWPAVMLGYQGLALNLWAGGTPGDDTVKEEFQHYIGLRDPDGLSGPTSLMIRMPPKHGLLGLEAKRVLKTQ